MIVPMSKVYVVSTAADRDRLLDALGSLGVLHIRAVDPARAVPGDQTLTGIDHIGRAMQILDEVAPAGPPPQLSAEQAAEEVLAIQRTSSELHNRLTLLHLQYEHLAMWGDTSLEQLRQLAEAGLNVRFIAVSEKHLGEVRGECVQVLSRLPGRVVLAVVVDRAKELAKLPATAREIPLPTTDRPAIRREAAEIDGKLEKLSGRLAELATIKSELARRRRQLRGQADYTVACRSALADEDLFALQGWVPADQAAGLAAGLAKAGLRAAVEVAQPAEDDKPPTLIRAPRWAKPIEGLLKMLGTVPGYREHDVSPAFMIALPVFAAMLIGDAGYGLLFVLVSTVFHRRLAARMGKDLTNLMTVFGATALAWGVATGNYFGFGPAEMIQAGGPWAAIGEVLGRVKVLSVEMTDKSQDILKRISFLLAAIHLSSAHLWRACVRFPDVRFFSSLGWAAALWGVFGLVKMLVLNDPFAGTVYPYLIAGGLVLAVVFATPRKYIIDGILLGALSSIFPAIATLSDTISYVRLMAIGLASSVLAASFNRLALGSGSWAVAAPVMIAGHLLNIGLCTIALFAHALRLNILEFSNNLGMEWSGYSYEPFVGGNEEN